MTRYLFFKHLWNHIYPYRGLGFIPLSLLLIYLTSINGIWQSWELAIFDYYMRLRPEQPRDDRIVIIGINETDIQEIGTYPFSDQIYAELLAKLLARKPVAIALDIYRDIPIPPGTQDLNKIFNEHNNIIGITKIIGDKSRETVPPHPILQAKNQIAANDVNLDVDGRVRRMLLTISKDGKIIPTLGTYLAAFYLDQQQIDIDWEQFPPLEGSVGGYINLKPQGYEIILNYRGSPGHFETVSVSDVLNNRLDPDWGRDRIIFIGNISESGKDFFFTPYSTDANSRMSGVEIHANLTSLIINRAIGNYPVIKTLPEIVNWLWISFWTIVASWLIWQKRYSINLICFTPGLGLILGWIVLLNNSYWLPLATTILSVGLSQFGIMGLIAYQGSQTRHIFGRYLDQEIVAHLTEHPEALKIGGKKQEITILVSDLRGFTAVCEEKDPETIVKILNYYFEQMTEVITSYQGMIDEFLGDGILVLFGVPNPQKDDAVRAIACAIAMEQKLIEVNQHIEAHYGDFPPLQMGIGINTGEVIVGNIGSPKRTKYGVVGNTINITYRIESCTIGGQIFISQTTKEKAQNLKINLAIAQTISKHFKGANHPQNIYLVTGIEGEYNLKLEKIVEVLYPLPNSIQVIYHIVEYKDINQQKNKGELKELSTNQGKLYCDKNLPSPLANIMLQLVNSDGTIAPDCIYAKVLTQDKQNQEIKIHFTLVPSQAKIYFQQLY